MSDAKFYDGKNDRIIIESYRDFIFKVPPAEELLRINELSYGYHTFDELYEFRKMYNALLFNECGTESLTARIAREAHNSTFNDRQKFQPKYDVHKSWKHFDGEDCFAVVATDMEKTQMMAVKSVFSKPKKG